MKSESTPNASYGLHANTSKLFTKNKINFTFSKIGRLALTWKYLSPWSICIFSSCSQVFLGRDCSCYKGFVDSNLVFCLCPTVAIWHFQAMHWSPIFLQRPAQLGISPSDAMIRVLHPRTGSRDVRGLQCKGSMNAPL